MVRQVEASGYQHMVAAELAVESLRLVFRNRGCVGHEFKFCKTLYFSYTSILEGNMYV